MSSDEPLMQYSIFQRWIASIKREHWVGGLLLAYSYLDTGFCCARFGLDWWLQGSARRRQASPILPLPFLLFIQGSFSVAKIQPALFDAISLRRIFQRCPSVRRKNYPHLWSRRALFFDSSIYTRVYFPEPSFLCKWLKISILDDVENKEERQECLFPSLLELPSWKRALATVPWKDDFLVSSTLVHYVQSFPCFKGRLSPYISTFLNFLQSNL